MGSLEKGGKSFLESVLNGGTEESHEETKKTFTFELPHSLSCRFPMPWEFKDYLKIVVYIGDPISGMSFIKEEV